MFNNIPINTDIVLYILVVGIVILLIWIIRLEFRMKRLLLGKDAKSLEDTIMSIKEGQKKLEQFQKEVEKYLENAEKRLRRSVQGVSTIRFNPFKGVGVGGNQSFSTAFLNEHGDGVVISALYARERMSFYSKPIETFTSAHELTEEEKAAIQKAKDAIEVDQ